MAPKKKGGGSTGKKKTGKKSGSASYTNIIDGVAIKDMSREQLEGHIGRLRRELEREREERSYFQLERDQLVTFWDLSRQQLDEVCTLLRNKERDLEEAEDKHELEIKVYKQRVKSLLLEHKHSEANVKTEAIESLHDEQEIHLGREAEMKIESEELKVQIQEQEICHEEQLKQLKLAHSKIQSEQKSLYEKELEQIENKWQKRMKELKIEYELQRSTLVHEIEERKNSEINTLIQNHDKVFTEIKNYYNDIMLNNLALLSSNKEKIEEYKKREEKFEKEIGEIKAENKLLSKPLQHAKQQMQELQKQLANYEQDKSSLKTIKSQQKLGEQQLKRLQWEKEVLQQRFLKVEKERDEIYQKFLEAISQVQQKSSFKNLLLEKQLQCVTDNLEKREVQLSEILTAANLEPTMVADVSQRLEDLLSSKNQDIRDLQLNYARVVRVYNDLLKQHETLMKKVDGSSSEDVRFNTQIGSKK